MQARFLLGPAGSGKTFCCLAEIRAALAASPESPPLVLLAPKQATFQLERQLLADSALSGYTRLNIFSFERLARFVLDALGVPVPAGLLAEEGRVMVLRALLMRHESELKLFRPSVRRPGFAQQLSQLLGELQQHQFTPAKLRTLSARFGLRRELQDKLHDLALLFEAYTNWLAENELQDGNRLLDAATAALREIGVAASRQSAAISSKMRRSANRRYNSTFVARWFCGNDAAGIGFARRRFAAMRPRHARVLPRQRTRRRNFLALHLVVHRQNISTVPPAPGKSAGLRN